MPNPQEIKQQALGTINGALTALEMYPEMPTVNTLESINLSTNPIDFILDIFKSTMGYDQVIEYVSQYVAYGIPVLEVATKAILLSNIQNILSCSLTPLISREIVKNGVMFDIHQIDLLNIFNYSPLSKEPGVGKYYYFGCDDFTMEDEVKYSEDLNAVIWYCIQHPNERVVWKTATTRQTNQNVSANIGKKHTKDYGIVTFEYSNRPSAIKNYEGNAINVQEPIASCLHCFVGCADNYITPDEEIIRDNISACNRKLDTLNNFFNTLKGYKQKVDKEYRKKNSFGLKNGEDTEYFETIENVLTSDLDSIKTLENLLTDRTLTDAVPSSITLNIIGDSGEVVNTPSEFVGTPIIGDNKPLCFNTLLTEKYGFQEQLASIGQGTYPQAEQDYYFKHLLMEFNTDFVLNTKLFDEKVVTARLIDALTSNLDMSVDLSIEERVMRAQIREMVERIIENDDAVVNDCFFSFTNEQYDSMLQQSENYRMGIRLEDPVAMENAAKAEEILEALNNLSPDATQEEVQSVVKGMLFEAMSSTNPHTTDEYSYDLNLNILEKLLTQLVYIIVTIILSPKVYLILMINLKLMGHEPNFDLKKFIEQFKQLIVELIRSIRDQIIQFFYDIIKKILEEIFFKLGIQIQIEQYKYYIELLKHCLDCLKLHANEYDWAQDAVNYADITEVNQIINQEC